jgi:hypothetical protein
MSTTVSALANAGSVKSAMGTKQRKYELNPTAPSRGHLIQYSRTLTAAEVANFDGAGDYLELFTFPPNTYLEAYNVTVPDMDAHATPAVTLDVMAGSTVLTNDSTTGQAGGTIKSALTGITDVSDTVFKLKIETGPATAQTSYSSAFVALVKVYYGAPAIV